MSENRSYRKNIHSVVHDAIPKDVILQRNKEKSWHYGYHKEYDVVVISKDGTIGQIININQLQIALPSQPDITKIRKYGLRRDDQLWTRYDIPDELLYFDDYIEESTDVEAELNRVNTKYKKFIDADISRQFNGDWFINDGEAIYITGYYYFFLQHYLLTDMNRYGDFRMPQRDYFIWLEACFADERSLGSVLLKSRRMSFSTSAGCIVDADAITSENAFYPIISNVDDSAQHLFTNHVVLPFNALPRYLQPQRKGEHEPKVELSFSAVKKKYTTNNKTNNSNSGRNTRVRKYTTTFKGYDGTQVRKSINDEIYKRVGKLDFYKSWNDHLKMAHYVGSKIVGKAICGSTAAAPNEGGKLGEKFHKESKLSKRDPITQMTPTGLYSIFIATDYTTMGFFDKWGYVIYHDPETPILNEIGELKDIGIKRWLDAKELSCGNDIEKLNSQKRNEPRNENDPFLDEKAINTYDTIGMVSHINFLQEFQYTEKYRKLIFRFDLIWKDGKQDGEVIRIDNANGRFWCSWLPSIDTRNKYRQDAYGIYPVNAELGAFGVDPYLADRTKYGQGSKQGIVGITADNPYLLSENERNKTFLHYNFRPETLEEAFEDVIKMIKYFSMPIFPEHNKQELVKTLHNRGYRNYVITNPLKRRSELTHTELVYGGIYAGAENNRTLMATLESYIKTNVSNHIDEDNLIVPFLKLNEEARIFTNENRTHFDSVVAWQLAAVAVSKSIKPKEIIVEETPKYDILKIFENKLLID